MLSSHCGLKPNKTVSPYGIKLKISFSIKHLGSNDLDVVIVQKMITGCRVYRCKGKVASLNNAVLLIFYETAKDGFNNLVCIPSTDMDMDLLVKKLS